MDWVKITFKDGTEVKITERGRAGGSYTLTVKYEGAFVIVVDEWGATQAFPASEIQRVDTAPTYRSW